MNASFESDEDDDMADAYVDEFYNRLREYYYEQKMAEYGDRYWQHLSFQERNIIEEDFYEYLREKD